MKKVLVFIVIQAVGFGIAVGASATPINSETGLSWFGGAAIGGGSGTTVAITPHPAWQANNPLASGAVWISYGDTGYGGSLLAPPTGSATNLDGKQLIITVKESFDAGPGGSLHLTVWADDTARVLIDGTQLFVPNFTQNICANGQIGCTPSNAGVIDYVFQTGGQHTLAFDLYQVGSTNDTFTNPFGLLFAGELTDPPAAVPEPSTWLLLLSGLAGMILWNKRTAKLSG